MLPVMMKNAANKKGTGGRVPIVSLRVTDF
jgi:hypothetical protein